MTPFPSRPTFEKGKQRMEENKERDVKEETTEETTETKESTEEKTEGQPTAAEKFKAQMEEIRSRAQEANEALAEGKGKLHLEKPIALGDETIEDLVYDFTEMTGMEYIDAMDSDQYAQNVYKITGKQALALFAKAAAKQTSGLDTRDIMENIGITDTVEAVQLATLFFNASTRAGRLRISKK